MSRPDAAIDDLVALARRGDLSEHDERRLREQLASDDDSNELYEAGRAFDLEDAVRVDDGSRIETLVHRVEQRARTGGAPRRKWLARAALGAAMLAGAAVGAVELASRPSSPSAPTATSSRTGAAPRKHGTRWFDSGRGDEADTSATIEAIDAESRAMPATPVRVEAPALAETPAPVEAAAPVATPHLPARVNVPAPVHAVHPAPARGHTPPAASAAPLPAEPPPVPVASPPPPTAAEMFASANQARVRGELAEAIRQSHDLIAHYPQSKEATSAHLSLGLLYLQVGKAESALDEFHRYRTSGGGTMVTEALWGESQALAALNRSGEERAVLQELLAKYPQSAYAAAAQKRLDALP